MLLCAARPALEVGCVMQALQGPARYADYTDTAELQVRGLQKKPPCYIAPPRYDQNTGKHMKVGSPHCTAINRTAQSFTDLSLED